MSFHRIPFPYQVVAAQVATREVYGITLDTLCQKTKQEKCTHPRQLYWLLLHKEANGSYWGIAKTLPVRFGKNTVKSGIITAQGLSEVDRDYAALVSSATMIFREQCKAHQLF
jgi:chromosomal replication initiation ATPase DnaA